MVLLAQVERQDHIAGVEERLEYDARGGGDAPETDDGMVAVKEFFCACADNGGETQAEAGCLVAAFIDAVRQDAPLEVLRKRRHGVHVRQE